MQSNVEKSEKFWSAIQSVEGSYKENAENLNDVKNEIKVNEMKMDMKKMTITETMVTNQRFRIKNHLKEIVFKDC